jgi:hypothetical protein
MIDAASKASIEVIPVKAEIQVQTQIAPCPAPGDQPFN